MKTYPHVYRVAAKGTPAGTFPVQSPDLPDIATAPPPEFDGPGGVWSPETLLVASVADCFILTFRAIARTARFEWQALDAQTEGTLEKATSGTQFTRFTTKATLTVAPGTDHTKAHELLERAEKYCLIANSLKGERVLSSQIIEA
jgi:organic hydroperoxide reductase OsmC/OhrA